MPVFACIALDAAQLARLREIAAPEDVVYVPEPDADDTCRADFERCEIAFGNPPATWLAASGALRWVQLESVGFGEYAALDWKRLGARLTMTNLAGFFAEPVAESVLAGILALRRGIDRLVRLQQQRQWLGDDLRPALRTMDGAHVVLFGHGSINRRVGELLAPFRCRVVTFASDWSAASLDTALAETDVLVCTAPDTPGTHNVFSRERLARLRPEALFVNFGRGSVVDEQALAEALAAGGLAGAVIDVTNTEPLPDGHPLWSCDNALLTQHTGGGTADEVDRKIEWFAANLARYRRGEPLLAAVDFRRGY